jgi:hypothetical protein
VVELLTFRNISNSITIAVAYQETGVQAMQEAPLFFLPAATPETQESIFVEFARLADRPVPATGERVYSITYTHNGEIWTSTVGESSRGFRRKTMGKGRDQQEREIPLADPALTLAIFPGNPYVVVTDHGIGGHHRGSDWANPFMVGESSIKSTTRFLAP